MSLDPKVKRKLTTALNVVDEQAGIRGSRLVDDARRLWDRVQKFVAMHLVGEPANDRPPISHRQPRGRTAMWSVR